MKLISRKLRSRSGASMILALVFLLFALFVGGTVLASASANGYRAAHLSDQQEYLNHRSAALLVAEELGQGLTLSITETATTTATGTTDYAYEVKMPKDYVMTPLQRVMVEAVIAQFVDTEQLNKDQVKLNNFFFYDINNGNAKTQFGQDTWWDNNFWWLMGSSDISTSGTVSLTMTGPGSEVVLPVTIECLGGADDLYDIRVTLGTTGGMTITMDGYTGSGKPVPGIDGTTTTRQIAISWDAPVIEKGTAVAAEEED